MIHWTLLQLLGAVPGQREIFEKICLEIIKVEHPNARSIREDRGDHGIDIYVGDFDNGIHIYQAKFFRDAIGESQRSQIRASYNRILDVETDVKSWTLMVPLEFSFDEITWFETWEKKKAREIRLMSGLQLEEKVRRPGYEEARKILSN